MKVTGQELLRGRACYVKEIATGLGWPEQSAGKEDETQGWRDRQEAYPKGLCEPCYGI